MQESLHTLLIPDALRHTSCSAYSKHHLPMWVEAACVYMQAAGVTVDSDGNSRPAELSDICKLTGISQSSLKEYLSGSRDIPYCRWFCIVSLALNLDPEEIRRLEHYVVYDFTEVVSTTMVSDR